MNTSYTQKLTFSLLFPAMMFLSFGLGKDSFAQSPATSQERIPAPVPEHPITMERLHAMLEGMGAIEAQKVLMHESLEAKRKTMPAWFPADVWEDLETKVEGVDIVKVAFPVYQKYVSQEQADTVIFLLQGPTGKEIQQKTLERVMKALHSGASGSKADDQATVAGKAGGDRVLWQRRINELTPEQREQVAPLFLALQKIWSQIDDEQDVLYRRKTNEVYKAVLNEHMIEIQVAQRRARLAPPSQTTPNQAPAPQ
jgi:hypothetical protein